MGDYDNDILLQMQRDGIRTISGQHMHREAVWEQEGRHIECLPCQDQGCDFCNDPDYDGGLDGEGDRDWKLDR